MASIGTNGALPLSPLCLMHYSQFFMADFPSIIIPGHQNCSNNKDAVQFLTLVTHIPMAAINSFSSVGLQDDEYSGHFGLTLKFTI